jgi:hypothetical protein
LEVVCEENESLGSQLRSAIEKAETLESIINKTIKCQCESKTGAVVGIVGPLL